METPAVLETFVTDCKAALCTESPRSTIYRHMEELFADPVALAAAIPRFADDEVVESERGWRLGGEHIVYGDDDLTIMVLDTLPGVRQPPHDHNMHAFIGVFEGCEAQRFWLRTSHGAVPAAGRNLTAGEFMLLGTGAIHAISAPADNPARAIHVYLGDIYDVDRSVFDPVTLAEYPMSPDRYDQFCQPIGANAEVGPELPAVLYDFARACDDAAHKPDGQAKITALLTELVASPSELAASIPRIANPRVAPCGLEIGASATIPTSPLVRVQVVETYDGVLQPPHDHAQPAWVGVFDGCEHQRLFSRAGERIAPAGEVFVEPGDVFAMEAPDVHAISAPAGRPARAIHVYLGQVDQADITLFDPDALIGEDANPDRYVALCKPAD